MKLWFLYLNSGKLKLLFHDLVVHYVGSGEPNEIGPVSSSVVLMVELTIFEEPLVYLVHISSTCLGLVHHNNITL